MESGSSLFVLTFKERHFSIAIFFYGSFHAAFDVYAATYKWKWACGGDHCIWIVQEDGFYLYQIQKHENVKKQDWEKNI